VLDEHVIFLEAARIEQYGQALTGRQPALRMLRCNALFAAPESRKLTPLLEFLNRSRQRASP
jgi:hypothetical protein